jgi:hypothetical protein
MAHSNRHQISRPTPVEQLNSARAKLKRAQYHIKAFAETLHKSGREPVDVVRETNPRTGGQQIRLAAKHCEPYPDELGQSATDYASALLAAMNHLTWALVRGEPRDPDRIKFPIFDDETKFSNYRTKRLETLSTAATDEMEKLQPYHLKAEASPIQELLDNVAHAHPLWRIGALAEFDKHRKAPVVTCGLESIYPTFHPQSGEFRKRGQIMAYRPGTDDDPVVQIPEPTLFTEIVGIPLFEVRPVLVLVMEHAERDSGGIVTLDELPFLGQFVQGAVFARLAPLVKTP